MESVKDLFEKYLSPPKQPRRLQVEFAGEVHGCDPSISELLVPCISIYIPKTVINHYNRITKGKNSKTLPDPDEFWRALNSNLIGRGLVSSEECGAGDSVDAIVEELLEWPHSTRFHTNSREGVVLEVKADYNPYEDDDEDI